MPSVEASKLSKAEHDELCCSYAALMLHDEGLEINVSTGSAPYPFLGRETEQGDQGFRKRS